MHIRTEGDGLPDERPGIWTDALAARPARLDRPSDVPAPESVDEVARWAGNEDLRRTVLVHAPVFWVLLPLAALAVLVWGTITDPGDGWTGNIFDDDAEGSPWNFWLVWVGVGVWLLVAIGVLILRLSVLRDVRAENEWVFAHGVAYSIHRASRDYDDGEACWATYIALDHRLDDRKAARIHTAFEQYLSQAGLPPSGSEPLSSATLFGAQAKGGYFILDLPVSQMAGAGTEHRWMLLTPPRSGSDDTGEVIVTPVPVPRKLQRIRRRLRRRAARRNAR